MFTSTACDNASILVERCPTGSRNKSRPAGTVPRTPIASKSRARLSRRFCFTIARSVLLARIALPPGATCGHRQVSSQNRTRHGRFGKDAWLALRQKQSPNVRAQGSVLPRFPSGAATPASIIDALKAAAGLRPGTRASFAWGRCVRGTYAPLIRPGRSRNPAASPSHRACWRASLWTAAIRRRRTRTSCCAASASGSAATVSARKFSRKAPRFICQDARSDAGFPCGTHSGTGRQAGLGEGRGILRQQS